MNTREHLVRTTFTLVLGALLAACASDAPPAAADSTTVYRSAGKKQCEEGGLTSAQSAAALTAAGVQVSRSGCGLLSGVMYPAVCGGATGDIVLHEIPSGDLAKAAAAGYEAVAGLASAGNGRGYDWVDCETRTTLP